MSDSRKQPQSVFESVYSSEEQNDRQVDLENDDYDKDNDDHDNGRNWNRQSSSENRRSTSESSTESTGHPNIRISSNAYNKQSDVHTDSSHRGYSHTDPRHSTTGSSILDENKITEESEEHNYKPRDLECFKGEANKNTDKYFTSHVKSNSDNRESLSEDSSETGSCSGRYSAVGDMNKPTKSTQPSKERKLLRPDNSSTESKKKYSVENNEIAILELPSGGVRLHLQGAVSAEHGSHYRQHGSYDDHGSVSMDRSGRSRFEERGSGSRPGSNGSWDMLNDEEIEEKEKSNLASSGGAKWKGTSLDEFVTVKKENWNKYYNTPTTGYSYLNQFDLRVPGVFDQRRKCVDLPSGSSIEDRKKKNEFSPWGEICGKLRSCKEIDRIWDLKEMILSYNRGQDWDFSALGKFLNKHGKYWKTVGEMGMLASQIEKISRVGIPYLTKGFQASIALNKKQIACLLCNAFFCTFPGRNPDETHRKPYNKYGRGRAEGSSVDGKPVLPTINFSGLFREQSDRDESLQGKLHCLFNYFERVTVEDYDLEGCVTFERRVCQENDFPEWSKSTKKFTRLNIRKKGFIEDEGTGMLQVDFANKKVGGGVLGRGCVQEEIRFLICPELIISRLFTEELDYNETLLITGCERFSNFSGYARSFRYDGNCKDSTESDTFGRKLTQVVAMDAKSYRNPEDQFRPSAIDRELKKAYCGFRSPKSLEEAKEVTKGSKSLEEADKVTKGSFPAVATGNWGCGAFNGDRHVKALIQLMAAAEASRDVLYITIDDDQLVDDLFDVHKILTDKELTVGNAFNMLKNYATDFHKRNFPSNMRKLFDYIKQYNSDVVV